MFFEYALEPKVLSTWDQARFFLDAFGPWKGRFLADFPRHWKRSVYESIACPEIERKKIVERLSALDRRVFSSRTQAVFDDARSWVENAGVEHARIPFRAIIASSARPPDVLDAADVDDRCERWRVESGCMLPRDPDRFALELRLLLQASKRVLVIDPYFRADQDDKTRSLLAFCRILIGQATSLEVHISDGPRSYDMCMRDAQRVLPRILPPGIVVTLRCWKERAGGARLHNRYVLTEVGGVEFGDGIELGDAAHQDRLSILDEPSRQTLWEQYAGSAPAFDIAGPTREFVGVSGRQSR